jgi:ATP-dependent Zn protease
MAAEPTAQPTGRMLRAQKEGHALSEQWRPLTRAATFVAVLTAPALFFYLRQNTDWNLFWTIVATAAAVVVFRGLVDVGLRRFIPWPTLFGVEEQAKKEEDATARRRAFYWRRKTRLATWILGFVTAVFLIRLMVRGSASWSGTAGDMYHGFIDLISNPAALSYAAILPLFMIMNFLILFGPMVFMGISQMSSFEPGDADWGVRLDHVRGQKEAKEEVHKVVNLWQSGEAFEKAGGKRERGLLFLGAPGTGKTMLAKAIATGFNSPIVTMPGSGFAQTFIGMDVVIVRFLARKAKKLAAKWGGQCIVFIDEIDAVGMRRNALQGGMPSFAPQSIHDVCFFGDTGALTPTGDLVLQSRAWAERMFQARAPQRQAPAAGWAQRLGGIMNFMFPGMGGMGSLALNQLLVVMDGIDNPPFLRRATTNRLNTWLDASYIVPRRVGKVPLRLPQARPTGNQIYFIGATNVPLQVLDPALTRPGRMGRHVWFRTPTKNDRLDIFDLYIERVAHEPELDTPPARDELARITNGYSPAMIEQVCSMALTQAHHNGRERFGREDILEAMTTIEAGTAIGWDYIPEEARATAIHEAGHAVTAHVYLKGAESTRLSIRRRGFTGGHHQAAEKEERFGHFRSEEFGYLIWSLGAMAAEHAFYGENTNGVGGDVQSATALSATMVGAWAMGPVPIELNGRLKTDEEREEARREISKRFIKIGDQIVNRTSGGSMYQQDPIAGVLSDRAKRELAAELIGQAYLAAYHLVSHNKDAVERVADALIERKEIYGDQLMELLDDCKIEIPEVDLTDAKTWPTV